MGQLGLTIWAAPPLREELRKLWGLNHTVNPMLIAATGQPLEQSSVDAKYFERIKSSWDVEFQKRFPVPPNPDSVLTLLGKKKPFYEDGQENSSVGLTSGFSSEAPEQSDDTVRTEAVTEETARIHGYINRLTIDFRDSFPKNNFKDDVKATTESSSQVDLALINSARHSNDIVKAYKKNRKLFKALHRALNSPNYKLDQQRDAGWSTKNYESYVTSGSTVDTTLAPVATTRQKLAPPTAKKPKSPEDDPDPELLTKDQPDVGRNRDLATVALDKVTTPDPYRYIEQDAAVSADPGTWQRNSGYIPNTKKHASEITDMLYLTREIVQQLAADSTVAPEQSNGDCDRNPRCCKIERTICPDGTPVYYIKRYYRPIGSPVCMPYDYPACDPAVERNERPIVFEQNCQDLCFDSPHRHIDPLYQLTAQ
ncbi:unnamed protein product, partial [Mesorhabditis spiculigera]